jgi:DNA-binding NarL/FixJ family response regulator
MAHPINLRRILVADAHSLERLGVVQVLKLALSCTRFDDAAHFSELSALLQAETGMVVIDEALPGLTSLDELRDVRRRHPTTKFVIVSSSPRPQSVFASLMAGAHGFIPKALPADEMIEAFRHISRGFVYVPADLADGHPADDDEAMNKGWGRVMELSSRQRQVLQLACEGSSNKEIARKLAISEATVKVHVGAAFRVIGVTNRIHAAALFQRYRLSQQDTPLHHSDSAIKAFGALYTADDTPSA